MPSIPRMRFLTYFFCCRQNARKKFKGKLRQASQRLDRELDLERFIKRQRMLTTAVLGLLNRNQVFYASKMTQLVAYDEERKLLEKDSEFSFSDNNIDRADDKETSKSTFTDRIAKDLINSRNKVSKRLLKLHKIAENRHKPTDLISYLGIKDSLGKSLAAFKPA